MKRNHRLAIAARKVLLQALNISPPAPETMLGSLASVFIPGACDPVASLNPLYFDPLQETLLARHGIEVPIIPWTTAGIPGRLLRISAQVYNSLPQYRKLAEIIVPVAQPA